MPIAISLRPWEPRVGAGFMRVDLTVEGERAVVDKHTDVGVTRPNGWFAIYEDAVFGAFEWPGAKDCQVALFVEGRIWRLTCDVQLTSTRTLTHRSFSVKSETETGVVVFNYQRLWWNLLHKPKAALLDVVFADDWWGVVCDLPGWVEARWKAGKLAEEIANSLKERA
jgi:hypothetical protein